MQNKIPKFKSLEEERNFWDTHSVTDYLNELKPVKVRFAKPKKKLVSLRLENPQIEALKEIASRKGLGYLTLIRYWINQLINKEHRHSRIYH